MVQLLYHLKTVRFGYSTFSSAFASKTREFVLGVLKPSSHFSLENQLLCKPFTSKISADQLNFTVNYLIRSCGLSTEDAISASEKVELKSPERPDSVLALLRNHGGLTQTQISRLVTSSPRLLLANPEKTLLPKLEFFSSTVGVSRQDLARVVVYNPNLLLNSLENRIIPSYNFLKSILSEKNIVAVFKYWSAIFVTNCSTIMKPNVALLRELGMPQACISLLLAHRAHVLMVNPEAFAQLVVEVKEMGFDLKTSNAVSALHVLAGRNKLIVNRCRETYRRWGWSEADLLSAFRKVPMCMIMSEKKIMQVMDLLVNSMGWSSRMIAENPVVLGYSFEKRIIPRCSVVKVLLSKGLINEIENLSLCGVFIPVEKHFVERFVAKYLDQVPELLSVYQGKVVLQDA